MQWGSTETKCGNIAITLTEPVVGVIACGC